MAVKKKAAKKKTTTENDPGDGLVELAKNLITQWDAEGLALDRRIPLPEVASGLGKLIAAELLPASAMTLGGAGGVMMAGMAIKHFQNIAGLTDDGVLGRKSFSSLLTLITGDEEDASDAPEIPAGDAAPGNPATGLLFYFVESDLLNTTIGNSNVDMLIATAVFNWVINLDLRLRRTEDSNEANIVMKFENLDGRPGGTLGRANIGGRGITQQLSLRFDNNENWREDTFLNTATHELGHILGLRHVNDQNQIMSRFQNTGIQKPTPADIQNMQKIWGPPKGNS